MKHLGDALKVMLEDEEHPQETCEVTG